MEVIIQLLGIHISLIHKVICACFNRNFAHCLGVMYSRFGKMDERWDRTLQRQECVHFHAAFVMMKPCPRTELEAELYCAAVKGIDKTVNIKTAGFTCMQTSCPSYQHFGKVVVNVPILCLVDVGEGGTLYIFQARAVQLRGKSQQSCINATETNLASELRKAHYHELVSALKASGMMVAFILADTFVELIPR